MGSVRQDADIAYKKVEAIGVHDELRWHCALLSAGLEGLWHPCHSRCDNLSVYMTPLDILSQSG
jgi:hypothetical protein